MNVTFEQVTKKVKSNWRPGLGIFFLVIITFFAITRVRGCSSPAPLSESQKDDRIDELEKELKDEQRKNRALEEKLENRVIPAPDLSGNPAGFRTDPTAPIPPAAPDLIVKAPKNGGVSDWVSMPGGDFDATYYRNGRIQVFYELIDGTTGDMYLEATNHNFVRLPENLKQFCIRNPDGKPLGSVSTTSPTTTSSFTPPPVQLELKLTFTHRKK